MRKLRAIFVLLVGAGLGWLGWNGYSLVNALASDLATANALKSRLAEGERLVPARRSKELRGDESKDYWCFADGTCFYAMARFRVLYPSYNVLDDDVLINEARNKPTP
jgi:hypothetical protein